MTARSRLAVAALAFVTILSPVAGSLSASVDPSGLEPSNPDPRARCPLIGLTGLAGCQTWSEDWSGHRGDAMFPSETAIGPAGEVLVEAGWAIENWPSSFVGVVARDPATGSILWEHERWDPYPGQPENVLDVETGPRGERVYLAGIAGGGLADEPNGFLAALDAETGRFLWENQQAVAAADVATDPGGTVYVSGARQVDGNLTHAVWSLDPAAGTLGWATPVPDAFPRRLVLPDGGALGGGIGFPDAVSRLGARRWGQAVECTAVGSGRHRDPIVRAEGLPRWQRGRNDRRPQL